MMSGSVAQQLGEAMCAAWGLNPSDVMAIEVHWSPQELPYAVVDLTLSEGAARELLTLTVAERTMIEPAP